MKPMVAGENPTVEPDNGIIRSRDAKVSSTKNIAKHIKIILLVQIILLSEERNSNFCSYIVIFFSYISRTEGIANKVRQPPIKKWIINAYASQHPTDNRITIEPKLVAVL